MGVRISQYNISRQFLFGYLHINTFMCVLAYDKKSKKQVRRPIYVFASLPALPKICQWRVFQPF